MNAIPKPLKGMPMKFDYKYLNSEEEHLYIKQKTDKLLYLLKIRGSAFEIGEALDDVKLRLGQGLFTAWLETELHTTERTAQKYIRVTRSLGHEYPNLARFTLEILLELSYPATPKEIIEAMNEDLDMSIDEIKKEKKRQQAMAFRAAKEEAAKSPIMIHSEQAKSREATIQDLASQLTHMQQQLAALPPQVQEVVKYVTPPEILAENEKLRQEATKWHSEWEKALDDRRAIVEKNQYLAKENNAIAERYKTLLKEYERVTQDNNHLSGKINSLTTLVQQFHDKYSQIENANALIVDSTVVARQNGENQ